MRLFTTRTFFRRTRFLRILYLFKPLVRGRLDGDGRQLRQNARKRPDGCSYCPRRNGRVGFPSGSFSLSVCPFLSPFLCLFIYFLYPSFSASSSSSFAAVKIARADCVDKQLSERAYLVSSDIVLGETESTFFFYSPSERESKYFTIVSDVPFLFSRNKRTLSYIVTEMTQKFFKTQFCLY